MFQDKPGKSESNTLLPGLFVGNAASYLMLTLVHLPFIFSTVREAWPTM